MKFNQEILSSHLKALIALPESNDLVFSFYFNLDRTPAATIHAIRNELSQLRHVLKPEVLPQSLEAEAVLAHFIAKEAHPLSKGAAIFFRGGKQPFYLPIQFQQPIQDHISVEHVPHIVPLIEFKDRYDRYVVLISTEEQARIVEVVLGEVSKEQWINRPELRKRIGGEWTREHYQNHKHGRTGKFIKEKIALLEQVFHQGGYGHLILAGSPELVERVQSALPEHLKKKVIETIQGVPGGEASEIVMSTIEAFVEEESNESKENLERLEEAVLSDGPAAIGLGPCEKAFEQHQVDMLLMTRDESSASPQKSASGTSKLRVHNHSARGSQKQNTNLKKRHDALLKLAVEQKVAIEFVPRGTFLDHFDGVGMLLRYKGILPSLSEKTLESEAEKRTPDKKRTLEV